MQVGVTLMLHSRASWMLVAYWSVVSPVCHQDAAKADDLGDDIHRRLNAALSTFAIANTSLVVRGRRRVGGGWDAGRGWLLRTGCGSFAHGW